MLTNKKCFILILFLFFAGIVFQPTVPVGFLFPVAHACSWVTTSCGSGCADNKDIYNCSSSVSIVSVSGSSSNPDSNAKAALVAPPTVTQYTSQEAQSTPTTQATNYITQTPGQTVSATTATTDNTGLGGSVKTSLGQIDTTNTVGVETLTTNSTGGYNSQSSFTIVGPWSGTVKTCNCPNNTAAGYPGCGCNENCSEQPASVAAGQRQTWTASASCGSQQIDSGDGHGTQLYGVCAGSGHTCGASETSTPAPTSPPVSLPTPTPTGGVCVLLKVYKDSALVDPNTLKPGDNVTFAVDATNASQARLVINGAAPITTDVKDANNSFTFPYTVPSGVTAYTVTAEVFSNGTWQ